jgi:predicted double-glycine peptidase
MAGFFVAGMGLVLESCATAQQVGRPDSEAWPQSLRSPETLQQRRWGHVTKQQQDYSCAAGSIHTLLKHDYGRDVVPEREDLIRDMLPNDSEEKMREVAADGFSFATIKRKLEELGFVSRGLRMPWATLLELTAPAIVHLELPSESHFAVWRGAANGYVYLADPSRGNLVYPVERFAEEWSGVVLLPAPAGERPREYDRGALAEAIGPWSYRAYEHVRGANGAGRAGAR